MYCGATVPSNKQDVATIIAHEMTHIAGLDHDDTVQPCEINTYRYYGVFRGLCTRTKNNIAVWYP